MPSRPASRLPALSAQFPFPLLSVPGGEVEAELLRLRGASPPGVVPVILGDYEHALRLTDMWDEPFDLEETLRAAESIDPRQWFKEREQEYREELDEEENAALDPGHGEIFEDGATPMTALAAGFGYTGKPHPEVFIGLIPADDSTTAAAHLRFGGWNACPLPEEHIALARYWRDRYGAEIAVLSADTVEFTVARPPATDQEAAELATQQYLYCADIVEQGVGSVATLARSLRHSPRWFFWWD